MFAVSRASARTRPSLCANPFTSPMAVMVKTLRSTPDSRSASARLRWLSRIASQTQLQFAVVPPRTSAWTVARSPLRSAAARIVERAWKAGRRSPERSRFRRRAFTHARQALAKPSGVRAELLNAAVDRHFPQTKQVFLSIIPGVTVFRFRVRSPIRGAHPAGRQNGGSGLACRRFPSGLQWFSMTVRPPGAAVPALIQAMLRRAASQGQPMNRAPLQGSCAIGLL